MADREGVIVAVGKIVRQPSGQVGFQPRSGEIPVLAKGDRVGFVVERDGGVVQLGHADLETLDPDTEVGIVLIQSNQMVQ